MSLVVAIGLGVLFLAIQVTEYYMSTFTIIDGVFGGAFYLLTGFHGFHVCLGVVLLSACLMRVNRLTRVRRVGMDCAV